MHITRRNLLLIALFAAISVTAVAIAVVSRADAGEPVRVSALSDFRVLSSPGVPALPAQLEPVVSGIPDGYDRARVIPARRNLGPFGSTLWVVPSNSGSLLCLSLVGRTPADPAMGYCYPPRHPNGSTNHFKPIAFYSATDGRPRVQLFGVASDDVETIRAEVNGQWLPLELAGNAFYLDLPNKTQADVTRVEATLATGEIQTEVILH